MNIAALIVGIDGWQRYTLPLVQSIEKHEPDTWISVLDNGSKEPYPTPDELSASIHRTKRLCYSAAINYLHDTLELTEFCEGQSKPIVPDWYIVLSNDVLCTGPFAHILEQLDGNDVVGPLMLQTPIPNMGMVPYIEGWCMCFSRRCWEAIEGFDERFTYSSFEDVDVSQTAREKGFGLLEDKDLPFEHLDQRQRFYLPGYGGSEAHNMNLFVQKHGAA